MIKNKETLISKMSSGKLIILDTYDTRDQSQVCELTDPERNNTYDNVSIRLINKLVRRGELKTKITSRCLELFENTLYLPDHEKELLEKGYL